MKKINGVGISSLLVIFAVLCLTVFAILSVSTVQAQLRLAESTRRAVTGYYSADCCAENILAQLRAGEHPENVEKDGDTYTYACKISETQVLAVRVEVSGAEYSVLQWQAISVADWNSEDRLPVWDGQMP
ncbi:MAG: hypothetical protein IJF02_05625 [Oscillospiraceae bacterium]|nr:hypothetical protein [Oscillospiraceae bacterium]